MEDKVIEIARFEHTTEAEMLANLLKSEGVECYVRDSISNSNFFRSIDIGSAKVELLKKDARRALEIMKVYNYEIPEDFEALITPEDTGHFNTGSNDIIAGDETEDYNDEIYNDTSDEETEDSNAKYEKNKARLSRNMTIILVLMAILFGILVFLNKYFNG